MSAQKASRSTKLDLPNFKGLTQRGRFIRLKNISHFTEYRTIREFKLPDSIWQEEGWAGWIRGLRRNNLLTTWDKFKEDLRERFGKTELGDKFQELSHIQQTTSVATYLERFEELLNEVSGQSESTLISFFIGGLKLELRNELDIIKPTLLRRAFALVKVYEPQRGGERVGTKSPITEPLIKNPPALPKGVPIVCKMLTAEERKEHTVKGLCFNCDKS